METQPNQQPAQPPAAKPAPAPAQPAAQPAAQQPATAQTALSGAAKPKPLPADQSKSNRKFLIGCLGAFGCSILLFLGVLFAFLAFGSSDNPIFSFLGVAPGEVVNVLITLINLIFLVLVFASFIFAVIGVFKITTARKDDKDARRKGSMFTFISAAVMIVLIFIWIIAYFFLASKKSVSQRVSIATVPEKTINLTAPIVIKFDASKAPINRNQFDILSYNWDFGDGAELSGNPQTHTFDKLGNFKVTLTIKVKEKQTGKEQDVPFTRDVTIQNVLANVVIKADKTTGPAPLTVKFDGSKSNSPNGEITAYGWDLDGDSQYADSDKPQAEKTFDKIGTYKVGLRVTDSTGTFAVNEIEIEVTPPDSPIAKIAVEGSENNQLKLGKAYIFSAASSISPTGNKITKYEWEFGDSGTAKTRSVTHTYEKAGEYEVRLTVIDEAGKKGEITEKFFVKAPDAAPQAILKTNPEAQQDGALNGKAPFEVIFNASGSTDANDDIVEYAWDFDGDSKTDDANAISTYKFMKPGTYNVSLTVTDSTNLTSKAQIIVKVESPGLEANIKADPASGVAPLTVKLDASGSSYPDGQIVSYEWDFGEGKAPRIDEAKVTYQYGAVGTFTAKVTAVTSDNKRATAQTTINARSVPIKACFEPSAEAGKAPLEVEFDPTCATGTVVKYKWTFGSAGQSVERKPKFTFKDAGEYNATLEVSDSQGIIDTFSKKITVQKP